MTINSKKNIYLLFFNIIILVFLSFIIYSLFVDIIEDSQSFISEKNNFAELQSKNKNFRKLKNAYQNYQSELEKIDDLFIYPEPYIDFIEFLEKSAQDLGISIKISSVSSLETEKDSWNLVDYKLVLNGFSPNILGFLEKLETAPYLIEVSNFSVREISEKDIRNKEDYVIGDVKSFLEIRVYAR